MKNQKETITNLIVKGKTEAALEQLMTALEGNNDAYNEVVQLTARYNQLSRQMRMSVISNSEAATEQNKIVNAILELLKEVPTDKADGSKRAEEQVADERKKLALVIGCNDYEHGGSLKNPINDAQAVKQRLEELNFTVSIRENPDLKELKMAVDDFGIELKNFDVGLFYFAGHGVQVEGKNYLIPIDANLKEERMVEYDCIRADRVLKYMETGNPGDVNLIILDACRNNPFERSWNRSIGSRGLATMSAPRGSLIAYATAPGETASDGKGENGLYTGELIKNIKDKGKTINQMFQQVRSSVMQLSDDKQVPWESSSLTADFYFNK